MEAIDRIAILILKSSVGYAGIGAIMPTFQWYSAYAVRGIAGLSCGVCYDATKFVVTFAITRIEVRFMQRGSWYAQTISRINIWSAQTPVADESAAIV
ncbi:MAG: hypothetical protein WB791_02240 [Waddliaceae bacterium]